MNQYVKRADFERTGEVASRLAAAFGKRVAHRRQELQMTQEGMIKQLNHRLGSDLGRSTASVWENGHAEPSISTIHALAKVLGVTPAFLAYGVQGAVTAQVTPPPRKLLHNMPRYSYRKLRQTVNR